MNTTNKSNISPEQPPVDASTVLTTQQHAHTPPQVADLVMNNQAPEKTTSEVTDGTADGEHTTPPLHDSSYHNSHLLINSLVENKQASTDKNRRKRLLNEPIAFFDKLKRQVRSLVQKAETLIEEEINIPMSEESVNGMIERYVTKNVSYFEQLTTELGRNSFLLTCDVNAKGIKATLSGDFEVITFELNEQIQHLVFRQIGTTRIDEMFYDKTFTQIKAKLGLFFVTRILRKEPLAFALDYLDVATVNGDVYDFEIGQYFDDDSTVLKNLKRVQVRHAFIRDGKLYVRSGVNVSGFFESIEDKPLISDDDMPEAEDNVLVLNPDTPTSQRSV